MYHYVRRIKSSRYPSIKGLELSDFEEQVLYIKKNYNPVTISDIIAAFDGNHILPPNALLMTFDDAYIDHFTCAYPVLKKNGMQGCFYVPAKTVEESVILDVNKIHFILSSCNNITALICDIRKYFHKFKGKYNLKTFDEYYNELAVANRFDDKDTIFFKRFLQVALPEELRNIICDSLFIKYVGMDQKAFSKELYMSKNQIEHLVSDGMHIGCHGYDHYWWNKLPPNKMKEEIDKSLSFLKSIGEDTSKWSACYPYGSSSDSVMNQLKENGCKAAFTTIVDIANTNNSNRLLIPRLDTNDLPKVANASTNKWYK